MRQDRKPNGLLRHEREKKGWSQNKLAEFIGADPTMVSRWETGERKPDHEYQEKLCNLFQRDTVELGFIKKLPGTEPSSELWHPDSSSPETAPRRSVWSALWQEESEVLATHEKILYASLEVEIMAMALQWKRSSGSIIFLQQLTYEAIRKHDAMHKDHHDDYDTRITRRHALQAIALFPIQMYGLTHLTPVVRPIPFDKTLSSCAAGIAACWELRQDEPEGLATIQRILASYLPTLEHIARVQSSPSQQAAAYLAAQGYLLLGILANHYSKLEQMERTSRSARFYGKLAQDPNLEVSALIRLAVTFDFENRDAKTLETYQDALALPGFSSVSPLLQGRVYAGLAGMYAYCQQPSPALSYLSQARETFPTDPQSDPSYSIALCDANSLALWEGLTLQYTNHYEEATNVFLRFGSLTPVPGLLETHRAEHLNYATALAIQQRDLEAACTFLNAAEEVAWKIRHEHLQAEVQDTLKSLRLLWPQESQVKALQEKIYERQHV